MKVRPLVLGEQARKDVDSVLQYANSHKHSKDFMQRRMKNPDAHIPGDMAGYTCFIDFGYKCVYTVEEQPMGWCHHLSVSVDEKGKCPSIPAFKEIMKFFGIQTELDDGHVYMEGQAVNIIAKI